MEGRAVIGGRVLTDADRKMLSPGHSDTGRLGGKKRPVIRDQTAGTVRGPVGTEGGGGGMGACYGAGAAGTLPGPSSS